MRQNSSSCNFSTSDNWVILSNIEQSIKRKIESIGTPLKEWDIQINYGIKTGFNDAFIISTEKRNEILNNCTSEEERKKTDELIRPILRGRDIKKYGYDWAGLWLINSHNGIKEKNIPRVDINEYPAVKQHLDKHWDKLEKRADKGDTPYNLRNCAYMDDFNKPKIVYAELARTGNAFTLDMNNQMISNTSYMITFDKNENDECKLYCLLGFLNSLATLFYLDVSCSRFDENGWRWLRQYVENIPIPQIISVELYNEVANALKTPTDDIIKKINNLIFAIIGLDLGEINYLERKFAKY